MQGQCGGIAEIAISLSIPTAALWPWPLGGPAGQAGMVARSLPLGLFGVDNAA